MAATPVQMHALLLKLLLFTSLVLSEDSGKGPVSEIVLSPDYNEKIPPPGKTQVKIGFDIKDISKVNDEEFSVTLILQTLIKWNDSRIEPSGRALYEIRKKGFYSLSPHEAGLIWMPFLEFLSLKTQEPIVKNEANKRYAFTPEKAFRMYKDEVTRNTINCPMDFTKFPFDEHTCYVEVMPTLPVQIFEFLYFNRGGEVSWGRATTTTILPYYLTISDLPQERKMRPYQHFTGHNLTYSFAGFKLGLRRKATSFILNYYLPSGLFVMVSWTSYVIPIEATPGRVALLITTFLSLANIINSAFQSSPINQGINSMQIWIISCIGFVFVAMMEYFFLLCAFRFYIKTKIQWEKPNCWTRIFFLPKLKSPEDWDRFFLFVCPVLFVVFNILYWSKIFLF